MDPNLFAMHIGVDRICLSIKSCLSALSIGIYYIWLIAGIIQRMNISRYTVSWPGGRSSVYFKYEGGTPPCRYYCFIRFCWIITCCIAASFKVLHNRIGYPPWTEHVQTDYAWACEAMAPAPKRRANVRCVHLIPMTAKAELDQWRVLHAPFTVSNDTNSLSGVEQR